MKIIKSKILQGDKIIWSVYILFIFISIVEVFSSMSKMVIDTSDGSYMPMLVKHCMLLLTGFICCFVVHKTDYTKLSRYMNILLVFSVGLLFATLISAKISGNTSAARWISIPYVGQFQPSEIAKYVIIFYLSSLMASHQQDIDSKEVYWRMMIPLGIVCLLIFFENFSTAVLIFVTCFVLMFIGGVNRKLWLYTLLVLVGVILLAVLTARTAPQVLSMLPRGGTWVARLQNFGDDDYTQITQRNLALMAVSTGGLAGRGIGNTIQARFLDEGHNDFIFSIILEEGGIWFGTVIVLLYIILLYRMLKTARNASGYFGSLACIGMGLVITLQAFINMAVAVGMAPVTGQTLPFISYGGTSFVFASIFLGVIINISKKSGEDNREEEVKTEEEILQN